MKMRNVHEFDGKTPMKLNDFYTEDQVHKILNDADFLLKMQWNARLMTNMILEDELEKNMDCLNQGVNARQLFIALLFKISQIQDKHDKQMYCSLLEEQLCDMKNLGSCPQGRTIRLWQLFTTLS